MKIVLGKVDSKIRTGRRRRDIEQVLFEINNVENRLKKNHCILIKQKSDNVVNIKMTTTIENISQSHPKLTTTIDYQSITLDHFSKKLLIYMP